MHFFVGGSLHLTRLCAVVLGCFALCPRSVVVLIAQTRLVVARRVKLGVHEDTGEQVAVKVMDKSDIKAQEMTMNVRREIAIMKALKHKNIVNLRHVLTSATKLYVVMDLVTGGELFTKILNEGKLPEAVARRFFQQLIDGVDYCHRRGVCHRDLKVCVALLTSLQCVSACVRFFTPHGHLMCAVLTLM